MVVSEEKLITMKKLLLLLYIAVTGTAQSQNVFTVYFDFNRDTVNEVSARELSAWIVSNKRAYIHKIYGYADPVDTDAYNISLSQRRADYVLSQLQTAGLNLADNFEIKACGENFKLSENNALNRKVTIYYTTPGEEVSAFTKAVKSAEKGGVLKIPQLNFYNNSDVVLPKSKPILKELLSLLLDNPDLKIDIQGHICCQVIEKNKISQKRAVAIYRYLIKSGIKQERLSYRSFGSSRPIYPLPEKSEKERVANRRVEIQITDK